MATLTILCWRDIPVQVIAKAGRKNAKHVLSDRFQEAIDDAAMRSGARDEDAYLAEWRRAEPIPCSPDLEREAARLAAQLEADYTDERLAALIAAGGREAR
ncbi:MAG: virulence factor [Alphaproteobacteria bacterium]